MVTIVNYFIPHVGKERKGQRSSLSWELICEDSVISSDSVGADIE